MHQVEHERRCGSRQRIHTASQILAEIGLHDVRVVLQPWIDLAAIAAGCTPPRTLRVQNHDADALFGQVQRGREARKTGADDDHVGMHRALERRRGCGGWRAVLVKNRHVATPSLARGCLRNRAQGRATV